MTGMTLTSGEITALGFAASAVVALISALIYSSTQRAAIRVHQNSTAAANRIDEETKRASVKVDEFEAVVAALHKRIDELHIEVADVRKMLVAEQAEHVQTRLLLRVALRYIRELLMQWQGGDRALAPPPVPAELADEL